METWTIQKLLNWVTEYFTAKGLDSPRLCAELLLSFVLGLKRIDLYTQFNNIVPQDKLAELRNLVKRAANHEPVAYLTGKSEFFSLEFEITTDCLIPRPETELLVERAVEFLRTRSGEQFVCDLCTGCGCVAVAIAKNFTNCRIVAMDISETALKIAARNVSKYGLDARVELLHGDLFEPLIPGVGAAKFDLIVCNPPYVSEPEFDKLPENVRDFEPKSALVAGPDGLDVIKKLIPEADKFLKSDAALIFEIGNNQGSAVLQLLDVTGIFADAKIVKDYQKLDRLAVAVKKSH